MTTITVHNPNNKLDRYFGKPTSTRIYKVKVMGETMKMSECVYRLPASWCVEECRVSANRLRTGPEEQPILMTDLLG